MYSAMKRLIIRKFYKTADEAQMKIDVFYAVNRLSDEEYTELAELIVDTYETSGTEAETTANDGLL